VPNSDGQHISCKLVLRFAPVKALLKWDQEGLNYLPIIAQQRHKAPTIFDERQATALTRFCVNTKPTVVLYVHEHNL